MNRISRRNFLRAVGLGTTLAFSRVGLAQNQAFLNYWTGWSGFEFDVLQSLVDRFNAENPATFINMVTVSGQYDKVLTAIAGGNPPDVVSAVWLSQLVSMAAHGGFTPITQFAETDNITGESYFPQLWNAWQWNGDLWGLMVTSNANLLAYSPTLFAEIGVTEPPQTLDEFTEIAIMLEKVDASGRIERVGFLPDNLRWWGLVFGGTFYDEVNQKVTANDPKIVAALDWMASFTRRLGVERVAEFVSSLGDTMSAQNSFFTGQEAIKHVGEWFIEFQRQFAPDMEIDLFAAPPPPDGRPNCTTFDGSVFTIPTGVRSPAASWAFIKWLSQDVNMSEFCFHIQNIPPKIAPASEARFTSDPRFQLALNLLNGENAFGPDKMPVNDFYAIRLEEATLAVMADQMQPREALDQVTQDVQEELERTLENLA